MNPLVASDVWDWLRAVEWDVLPRSPFAEAVRYLKLPYQTQTGGNLVVRTTAQELFLVVAYCQNRNTAKQMFVPKNGFVEFKAVPAA